LITREYKCPKCGIIEIQCHMSDPIAKRCTECGSEINRYFEPTAYSWKTDGHAGRGFAVTGKRAGGNQ